MERLPDRGFLKQRRLLQLRLDDNLVRNVSNATAFVGLQSLTKLSLKGNRLEVIQAKTFEFLPKVKLSLDLFVPEHVRGWLGSTVLFGISKSNVDPIYRTYTNANSPELT